MRMRLVKLICLALALGAVGIGTKVNARLSGPPLSHTGAPARGSFPAEFNCAACHNGGINSDDGTIAVAVTPALFSPNQEVEITLSLEQLERQKFGFQAVVLDAQGRSVGQWVVTDSERTQVVNATSGDFSGRSYIQHTFQGTEPTGNGLTAWKFRWKAPVANVGQVTLFLAANAANNDGRDQGDSVYTRSVALVPAATLPTVATVSSASYFLNSPLAPDSIATVFGVNMTNATVSATTVPLPSTLAEAQVRVRDSAGVEREAPLFFVSPGQINFLVPAQTAAGIATVNVRLQNNTIATGTVTIARSAPGVFSSNADGAGVSAASLLRIKTNGEQIYEPVARYNETTRKFEALPLDVSATADQLFLILYGTGVRGATTKTCTIGGQDAEVLFAGAQGLAGLDQINVRLASSFAGRGNLNVLLRADNQSANIVTVNVR